MSTRTWSNGNVKARNTFGPAGRYRCPAAISARRNSPIWATCGATGSNAVAQPASTISFSGRAVTESQPSGPGSSERLPTRISVPRVAVHQDPGGPVQHLADRAPTGRERAGERGDQRVVLTAAQHPRPRV